MASDVLSASLHIPQLDIRNYQSHYWYDWYTQFKLLTRLSGFDKSSDADKVAWLLLKLGPDAMTIFKTFEVDIETVSFNKLISLFDSYFTPAMSRHVFLCQCQKRETFDQFRQRLDILSGPCCFGPFRSSLVRDVFIKNMSDQYADIRRDILKMPDPTLNDAVNRANELFYNVSTVNVKPSDPSHSNERNSRGSNESTAENQFKVPPLASNDEVQVMITWKRQNHYYVIPMSWIAKKESFSSALKQELVRNSRNVPHPEINNKYTMIFKGNPYRVVVIERDVNFVRVQCIDNGWLKKVSVGALRQTPLDFLVVQPFALKVVVIPPVQGELNEVVVMRFLEEKNQEWSVKLLNNKCPSSQPNKNMANSNGNVPRNNSKRDKKSNGRASRDGYATDVSTTSHSSRNASQYPRKKIEIPKGLIRKDVGETKSTQSDEVTSNTMEVHHSKPESNFSTSSETINNDMKNLSVQANTELQSDAVPPVPFGVFTQVKVVYAKTPQLLRVCRLDALNQLADMTHLLNEAYEKMKEQKCLKPAVGDECGATFEGDWYRARIISMDENKAQVLFYDFGNEEEIDLDTLMVLPENLRNADSLSFPIKTPSSTSFEEEDTIVIKPEKINKAGVWLCHAKISNDSLTDGKPVPKINPDESLSHTSEHSSNHKSRSVTPESKLNFQTIRIMHVGNEGTFGIPTDKIYELAGITLSIDKASIPCDNVVLDQIVVAPFEGDMYRAQVRSVDRIKSVANLCFIDFGNESSIPIDQLLEIPEGVSTKCFTSKIKVDPSHESQFHVGKDMDLCFVEQEADGSWIVQMKESQEDDDHLVKFTQK